MIDHSTWNVFRSTLNLNLGGHPDRWTDRVEGSMTLQMQPVPNRFVDAVDALTFLVPPPHSPDRLQGLRSAYDAAEWMDARKDLWHAALFSSRLRGEVEDAVARRTAQPFDTMAPLYDTPQIRGIYVPATATGVDVTLRPDFAGSDLRAIVLEQVDPGGGPTNAVRAMKCLGLTVSPLWTRGSGVKGGLFKKLLATEGSGIGMDYEFLLDGRDTASHVFLIDPSSKIEQRIIQPSPPFRGPEFSEYPSMLRRLAKAPGIMLVSSRPPCNAAANYLPTIIQQSHDDGHFVIVDPKPDQLRNGPWTAALLRSPIDLLKPDLPEFFELLRQSSVEVPRLDVAAMEAGCPSLVHSYARALLERHETLESLLVSLGEQGAILIHRSHQKALLVRAPALEVVSTVGAGDSGVAAFIGQLATADSSVDLRNPPHDLLARAVAMFVRGGSAAVLKSGTGVGTADDIRAIPPLSISLVA